MSQYCDNFEFSENNQDHFEMMPDSGDTFQFWQGLQGPYFVPAIDQDGWLSWTNNGGLPNPTPVQIVGKDGRGITLTGCCETVADLPEDPEQGEAWAVGDEEPFECYAWFGGWVDMGLLFPPGPPGQDGVSPAVTITTTTTGHKVKITDKDHPAGQEFDVEDGEDGEDGVSPAVTITTTTTGHKVKITDKDHPAGQEFDVENGEDGDPGPGVPAGGSAGQYLKKASATDYDGEWDTLGAGDVAYDDSLTYESGTVGEELSAQKNTLNQLETTTAQLDQNMAYIESGNTASRTYTCGQFISWKGTLYKANQIIPATTAFSAGTGGNLDSVVGGGFNSLGIKNAITSSLSVCKVGDCVTLSSYQWTSIDNVIPLEYRPNANSFILAYSEGVHDFRPLRISTAGELTWVDLGSGAGSGRFIGCGNWIV